MNFLPPGLRGYVAAEQLANQRGMNGLAQMQGLMALQQGIEQQEINRVLKPLQVQQLQLAVRQAQQNAALRQQLQGGAPTSPAFGEGGMSLPGGGQANMNTGQVLPPQQGGGIPSNIQSMLLSGDSGLSALGQAMLDRSKPIAAREGAPIVNPQTGEILFYAPKLEAGMSPTFSGGQVTGVSNLPGYVDAMSSRTRGQEGARAEFDLVDVPVAGGGARRMSRLDALNMLGGGSPQGSPGMDNRPPSEQAAIRAVMQADAAGLPASVTVPARPGMGFTPPKSDEAYKGERAKFYADRAGKLTDSWYTSNEINSKLDLLSGLFNNPNVASGALAENISDLKGVAESLGIQTAGKPAEDVIRAVTNEMAMRIKNAGGTNMMPGAMSDFEQKLLRSMVPNLAQSREGRMLMTEVMRAKVQQDMKISELAAEYEDRNGKID